MSAGRHSATTATPVKAPKIALLDHFARLADRRPSAKVVFPLPEILRLVLSATIAGCDDLVEVCAWGRERLDLRRRSLLCRDDIPSHDTLTDVVNALARQSRGGIPRCSNRVSWMGSHGGATAILLSLPSTARPRGNLQNSGNLWPMVLVEAAAMSFATRRFCGTMVCGL